MPDLLVEIAVEEMPAGRVRPAAEALRDGLAARLVEAGLLEEGVAARQPALGTPRRLGAFLPGVRERQPDRPERVWGPPVAAALGPDGRPTKAGEGFARSSGVPLERMGRGEKVPGKPPYLFADRVVAGRAAAEVIAEALPAVAASLPFRRTMRWPQSDLPFARPVRGLVVLLGEAVVPCRLAGVEAGRTTRGHAFLRPKPLELPSAHLAAYEAVLRRKKVIADAARRARAIQNQVRKERAQVLGTRKGPWTEEDARLLEEVAGLVEWPRTLVGSFEERHLELPPALLATAMAHHLRFFPVRAEDGTLRARFVSVTDREERRAEGIRAGNERVLRARLEDAAFFFRNDRRRRLEELRPALAGVDFHKGLGSLLDKSDRVRRIAGDLAEKAGVPAGARAAADRGAFLLKCDLLTAVVKEFPELQGVVGAHYARLDGEPEGAAAALEGQYLPRGEWDAVLDDDAAALVSLAEKADSLAACFSVGEEPTGAADPFGLRRHALGVLRILAKKRWPLSIEGALRPAEDAWRLLPEVRERLRAFLWGRADQVARSYGFTDFVDAVGTMTHLPYFQHRARLVALRDLSRRKSWKDLVALVERSGNMGEASPAPAGTDGMPKEVQALAAALDRARARAEGTADPLAFAERYLGALGGPVAALFDRILVDDPKEPERRRVVKHLLHEVHALFAERLGDLRKLGGGARPARP